MTENKRFTTDNGSNEDVCLVDNITGKEYESNVDEIVELLNELHEENRELQRHLDVMRSGALTDDKRIKELYDENEQLNKSRDELISENRHIKKTIQTMLINERTAIGKSVLKQLWNAIHME